MDIKKMLFYIEIPAGSSVKYEVDEETGMLIADRFLHTQMTYPTNYGYVVGTLGKDGDPVDVLVLSSMAVVPGVGIKGHVIGMLEMEDEEGIDSKLIAVPDKKVDPIFGLWESIDDVPKAMLDRIKHFFDHYKELEAGKFVKTKDWKSRKDAEQEIMDSLVTESDEECCCCGKECSCEDGQCSCQEEKTEKKKK